MAGQFLRFPVAACGRCFLFALAGIILPVTVEAAQPTRSTRTPVTLVSSSSDTSALTTCIGVDIAESGPVVSGEQFLEGLEFRIDLRGTADAQQLIMITALLKPNLSALTDSHDDDPEAQPAVAMRFYHLLRVHVGTRAWLWQRERQMEICREAATWIKQLRSRPVLFDRIGADGEPR